MSKQTFTVAELRRIVSGLMHEYTTLQEVMHNTRDLPDIYKYWKDCQDASLSAYNKFQTMLLKAEADALKTQLQIEGKL